MAHLANDDDYAQTRTPAQGSAPQAHTAHVAVIVLTRNGREDTLGCIASLEQSVGTTLSVIVVDNASQDGTAEAVSARFPGVSVVRQDHNLGFAAGNNVGIRRALELGVDYVFLLNNDTTVAPDAITCCVESARRHPDIGAACPIVYFADQPKLIWYAGAIFDPRRAHSGRMVGYRELDHGQFTAGGPTDRVTGAAVLIPRQVFEEVGLLDSDLFFLYEDVDWSMRARRAGYRIYFVPEAKVWHRVSASAGGEHAPFSAYYDTRNHLIVCERWAALAGLAALRRALVILAVHLFGARRARRRFAYVHAVLRGWSDGRRGRSGRRTCASA